MACQYQISVSTSDIRGSGTDGDVFIKIKGTEGEVAETHLQGGEGPLFERGMTNEFTIDGEDVGTITSISVRLAVKGTAGAWHLSAVEVVNKTTEATASFSYDEWLEKGAENPTATIVLNVEGYNGESVEEEAAEEAAEEGTADEEAAKETEAGATAAGNNELESSADDVNADVGDGADAGADAVAAAAAEPGAGATDDVDADVGNGADAGAVAVAAAAAEPGAGAADDVDADAGNGTDAGADAAADAAADTDAGAEAEAEAEVGAVAEAEAEAEVDAGAATAADADADQEEEVVEADEEEGKVVGGAKDEEEEEEVVGDAEDEEEEEVEGSDEDEDEDEEELVDSAEDEDDNDHPSEQYDQSPAPLQSRTTPPLDSMHPQVAYPPQAAMHTQRYNTQPMKVPAPLQRGSQAQRSVPGMPQRLKPVPVAPKRTPQTSMQPRPGGQAFTFSSAPNSVTARPHQRQDFSHNKVIVNKISYDNNKICKRLLELGGRKQTTEYFNNLSVAAHVGGSLPPANIANSCATRRKKEDVVAQENLALFKRLQAIKPSKEVNRKVLNKEFQTNRGYEMNARKFRAVQFPKTIGSQLAPGDAYAEE